MQLDLHGLLSFKGTSLASDDFFVACTMHIHCVIAFEVAFKRVQGESDISDT